MSPVTRLAGPDRPAQYLGFSPDGRWLVTGFRGHQREIYDVEKRRHHLTLTNSGGHFSFMPDGERLFTCSTVTRSFWRIKDWAPLRAWPSFEVSEMAFSAGGRLLLRDGPEGALDQRDPITATWVATLRAFEPTGASVVAHDAAGPWHATQNSTDVAHLWDWAALRARLAEFSLDWPEDSPGADFVPAQPGWAASAAPLAALTPNLSHRWRWLILGGTLLAIGFGAAMLNYQHRLFRAYGELDYASEQRAELINTGDRERVFTERLARQHDVLKRLRGTTEKPNLSSWPPITKWTAAPSAGICTTASSAPSISAGDRRRAGVTASVPTALPGNGRGASRFIK